MIVVYERKERVSECVTESKKRYIPRLSSCFHDTACYFWFADSRFVLPESNVLKDFPLSVRKVLCAEVVNYLIDNKFGRDILSS